MITMHSLNPKGIASTLLDHWWLNGFHLAPLNVQKLKWEDFLRDQLMHQEIASIREEIVNTAITDTIQRYCLEKTLFKFGSQCVQLAWLRLFDWLSLKVDPYWKCNCSGRLIYLIVDSEPQSGPADTWISGNVSRIIVQRSASFSGTIASKTRFSDHKESNILQKQETKLKSSKIKETEQTDKRKKKVLTPITAAITTMTTRSASATKVSTQSTNSFKTDRQANNCPSSAKQEYTKNVSTTNTNDKWRNVVKKNLKEHSLNSRGNKHQKHPIIRP